MLWLLAMSDTDCAQSASDSLHCHLSAMSDTDYTICIWPFTLSSVSRVWHWLRSLHLTFYTVICQPCLTLHSLPLTLYTVICQPCLTLTVHNLHLTLYTVMNWCWDCPPCLTLTVYRLSFRFVGRPGKYKTIFGARQEEVSVLLFFGCFSFGDHLFC